MRMKYAYFSYYWQTSISHNILFISIRFKKNTYLIEIYKDDLSHFMDTYSIPIKQHHFNNNIFINIIVFLINLVLKLTPDRRSEV